MFKSKCTNRKGGAPLGVSGYVEASSTRCVIIQLDSLCIPAPPNCHLALSHMLYCLSHIVIPKFKHSFMVIRCHATVAVNDDTIRVSIFQHYHIWNYILVSRLALFLGQKQLDLRYFILWFHVLPLYQTISMVKSSPFKTWYLIGIFIEDFFFLGLLRPKVSLKTYILK